MPFEREVDWAPVAGLQRRRSFSGAAHGSFTWAERMNHFRKACFTWR